MQIRQISPHLVQLIYHISFTPTLPYCSCRSYVGICVHIHYRTHRTKYIFTLPNFIYPFPLIFLQHSDLLKQLHFI